MTLYEFFSQSYAWADQNARALLLAGVALPAAGTLLARVMKGAGARSAGRAVASGVMALALLAVVVEIAALFVALGVFGRSVLEANVQLLAAPVACFAVAVVGLRWVFPLSQLGPVRALYDLGAFALACTAALWFFSKFHGWGLLFFGSFTQLIAVLLIAGFFLWRLFRRAFGLDDGNRIA